MHSARSERVQLYMARRRSITLRPKTANLLNMQRGESVQYSVRASALCEWNINILAVKK